MSMTHRLSKITNQGRRFSVCLDSDPQPSFFVHLTSKSAQDKDIQQLVAKSWDGFKSGYSPSLCESGVGGTYFLQDKQNNRIGVFKPYDEEMGMLNNPKGFTPDKTSAKEDVARRGVIGGEAAFRECAAYILDRDHFSGVPATDIVMCNHPIFKNSPDAHSFEDRVKLGSFQEFKEHDYDTEDISPKEASKFPTHEVHKIAILDIRMFNTDRHGGNILVRKKKALLPPTTTTTSVKLTPSAGAYRPPALRRYEEAAARTSSATSTSSLSMMAAESPPDLLDDEDDYDSSSSEEGTPVMNRLLQLSPNGADDCQFNMELDDDCSSSSLSHVAENRTTTTTINGTRNPFPLPCKPLRSSFASEDSPSPIPRRHTISTLPSLSSLSLSSSSSAETLELIPIDHGYTLPHTLCLADCWFEWLNWPQAKLPFSESDLKYIAQLNGEEDVQLLRKRLGDVIASDSLKVLRTCSLWLQIGANCGLSPYEIGAAMCRRNIEIPSELETMNDEAMHAIASANLTSSLMNSSMMSMSSSTMMMSSSAPSLSSSSDSVSSSSSSLQDLVFFEKLEEIMLERATQKTLSKK